MAAGRAARLAALGVALALAPAAGRAEEPPELKALTCTFDTGTSWTYAAGKFESKAPSPLSFEIEGIELEAQIARLKTAAGEGASLRIVRALNANHFLEVVNEGFLNLTTVYDKDPATGQMPAVHSRHFGLLGQPVFAQYTGHCMPK